MSKAPTNHDADHTGAQVVAADPTQSVWVSANAGTGKTHVLIERILRLLLAGTEPGKILCLTYTKAAAAEAAGRLSDRLGTWAAAADAALASDLAKLLGRPADNREAARARMLFALSLEAPEGVRIRTIHSFCESLLGRFPVEAGVAPHFAVIDDALAREIQAGVETRLLADRAGRPAAVTQALGHIAGLVDRDAFAALIKDLDSQRGRVRRLLHDAGGVAGVMGRARAEMALKPEDTRESLVMAAAADGQFDADGLARAADTLDAGSKTDKQRATDIRGWLALEASRRAEAFSDGYAKIFLTNQGNPRKTVITQNAAKADPAAAAILAQEQARVAAVLGTLRALAVVEATGALLTVGKRLIDGYEAAKRARTYLDYDDLIENAAGLLADDKGVSWVHYKLDGGIDHILVDEAQDTGPDSWEVIWRLSGDFFSGEGAGERPLARTVFAVGDEKQSIFSFQGAAPARFGEMRQRYAERIAAAGGRLQDVALGLSYRSTPAVLDAVNRVFDQPDAAEGLTWGSKPIRHVSNRPGQAGLVEAWPTLTPDEEPERLPWDAPVDQVAAESPAARLAGKIADAIAGWLDRGEILESAGRPIEPGDILILVRTRGTFADEMVRALERRGIPVTGRDRLKLMDHLAVMDLVAAGRFALLPEDDLNTAVVLKGPFAGFDDDDLFRLAHGRRKETLWHALDRRRDEDAAFRHAFAFLSGLLGAADRAPPHEFFADLLTGAGRGNLLERLGAEAAEPIDEFMAQTLAFERDHEPSLEGFLHWLETGDVEIKREMERSRDEVRVMTVHGAKGLEAPIVFLPDTCSVPQARQDDALQWKLDGQGGDEFVLWRLTKADEDSVARDLHDRARAERRNEYRRLLYVATTRARDRLYVAGWQGDRKRPDGCWYDLVQPVINGAGTEIAPADGGPAWRIEIGQKAKPDGAGAALAAAGEAAPPAWALSPPAPEDDPPQPLAPSAAAEDDPPVMSPLGPDGGARFRRGIAVHRLLQGLPDLAPETREAAARAYLDRPALGLEPDERDEIVAETLAVLAEPDFAALFGPGSLAEVPLTGVVDGKKGPFVLSGQVDRLLVTADAVTVVDYKTNRPPPKAEEDVDPPYLSQMAAYRAALLGVYPGRRVRGILLWTAGPRAMALSDQILDAHAP